MESYLPKTPADKSQDNYFTFSQPREASILVVDDENGPRQSLRMLLNKTYDIYMASGVNEAIEIVEEKPIDLVITDLRMPKRSGLDLLREVKQRRPEIQVIILTGYGQLDSAMKAIEFGASAYLEKPFESHVLLEKVRSCLERKRLEDERRTLEYLAMEANRFETLGRLVTMTMHDLGTPLSIMGTHIDLLLENRRVDDLDKRLRVIQAQVYHCNEMVRSTMNFLRHAPSTNEPFQLSSLVELCLEVAQPLLSKQSVRTVTKLDPDLPQCRGDLVLLRQAVLNLIYNACQAMEVATATADRQLYLHTWQDAEGIYLTVEDSGPGVAQEFQAHIFDTLFSTKGNSGTGLGLAVVRNVMYRHGGRVYLDQKESHGARFVLQFPINDP